LTLKWSKNWGILFLQSDKVCSSLLGVGEHWNILGNMSGLLPCQIAEGPRTLQSILSLTPGILVVSSYPHGGNLRKKGKPMTSTACLFSIPQHPKHLDYPSSFFRHFYIQFVHSI
jgi:hypothetical protein